MVSLSQGFQNLCFDLGFATFNNQKWFFTHTAIDGDLASVEHNLLVSTLGAFYSKEFAAWLRN